MADAVKGLRTLPAPTLTVTLGMTDEVKGIATLPEGFAFNYEGRHDPHDCARGTVNYTCTPANARYVPATSLAM